MNSSERKEEESKENDIGYSQINQLYVNSPRQSTNKTDIDATVVIE